MAGEMTHEEWMRLVADRLPLPPDEAAAAVAEWQAYRGEPDPEVLAFVREVRAAGRKVGLATNATDLLDGDLAALGLTGEVDVVVNSVRPEDSQAGAGVLPAGLRADRRAAKYVLFVDDDDRVVRGARAAGLPAYRWTGPQHLGYLRKALQLP